MAVNSVACFTTAPVSILGLLQTKKEIKKIKQKSTGSGRL
jgi:hypothetical protein